MCHQTGSLQSAIKCCYCQPHRLHVCACVGLLLVIVRANMFAVAVAVVVAVVVKLPVVLVAAAMVELSWLLCWWPRQWRCFFIVYVVL